MEHGLNVSDPQRDTWEYADEQALLMTRVAALEAQLQTALSTANAAAEAVRVLLAGVERMAAYQGVSHLLVPQ